MNTTTKAEFDYESYTRENAPDPAQIRRGPEAHKRRREAFRLRLTNHINMEIKHARKMRHVFISYCHENKTIIDRLNQALVSHDIHTWLDKDNIGPGTPWKQAIQQAIQHGDFFIACFSKEANNRNQTYMNEELNLAIKELHRRPTDKIWFIPVKLNECEIPDINIGEGLTLRDLQYINLYEDWDAGIQRILSIMPSESHDPINYVDVGEKESDECVLFRSIEGHHYFIPFQKVRWDSTEISLILTPTSSEQAAFLCTLRKDQQNALAFAHQEDAVWVKPKEVAQISTEGETVWEVILNEDPTGKSYKYRTESVVSKNVTLDQIADMRARRLLLNEKLDVSSSSLTQATVFDQMLLEVQIHGEFSSEHGNRLQAFMSPIPDLYQHFGKTPERFKKFVRLISVLYLKLSNTVEDILQLDVDFLVLGELKVKFRGRRSPVDINQEPTVLEFEGVCPLPE